jgi:hypothetical protein
MEIGIGYLFQFHHAAFIQPASAPAGPGIENTIEDDIHDMDALGPIFSRPAIGSACESALEFDPIRHPTMTPALPQFAA